jgi:hypothetical protein
LSVGVTNSSGDGGMRQMSPLSLLMMHLGLKTLII